jgi:16S rRNA (cytosine1402-N4)-methyltransferase
LRLLLKNLGFGAFPQLEDPARGFSFRLNGPLDMRMDTRSDITARDLVNNLPYDQLKSLFIRACRALALFL